MNIPPSSASASGPLLHLVVYSSSSATVRVGVIGELDLATAPTLGLELLEILHRRAEAVVDLDLADVKFIDCAGVRVLVAVRDSAVSTGRHLWIVDPSPIAALVLDVVGLLGSFTAPRDPSPAVALVEPMLASVASRSDGIRGLAA